MEAMVEQRNLKVSVENFGPVKQGEFELRPLTVFIGPNNSGKSYMSLLIYAFSQALSGRVRRPFSHSFFRVGPSKELERYSHEIEEWLRPAFHPKEMERKALLFKDLPKTSNKFSASSSRKT